jgi:hypothetical protein
MAYTKTAWQDRAVQYPTRYLLQSNGGTGKNLIPPFNEGWTLHENTRMRRANFVGKIAGSNVENPHYSGRRVAASLETPGGTWVELDNSGVQGYSNLAALDGSLVTQTTSTNTYYAQFRHSFNLIEEVNRKHGSSVFGTAVTTAERVAWLKANVSKLTGNWHGFGNGPAGNKAYFKAWKVSTSNWQGTPSTTSASVAKLSLDVLTVGQYSEFIDSSGFIHFLAYADASNGTIASTINTDYFELEVYLSAAVMPVKDYELTLEATAAWQMSHYFVPVVPSTQYTLSYINTGGGRSVIYSVADNGTETALASESVTTPRSFTVPAGVSRIKVAFTGAAAGTFTFTNPQLEKGSVATAWEPMERYTITQSPGIVTQLGTPINAANLNKIETELETLNTSLGGLQFRDTSGYVEYNDGSGWLAVGGSGMYVASATQQYLDATERTNGASMYVLLYKFIPLFPGELKISCDIRASGSGSGSDARLYAATGTIGDPHSNPQSNASVGNWMSNETPIGTLLSSATLLYPYSGTKVVSSNSTVYSTKTEILHVVRRMPIFFLLQGSADGGATSPNCQIKNFKISYSVVRGG